MFKQSISSYGTHHPSKAEAEAADRLIPLGYAAHDEYLPVPFVDALGVIGKGKADLRDNIFGIFVESKVSHLNGKKNKEMSDRGMARIEDAIRNRLFKRNSAKHRLEVLKNGWNHSAAQIAAKQKACMEAGYIHIVIFSKKPDEGTLKRLEKYKILWLQEGTREFQIFNLYRRMAQSGVRVHSIPIREWTLSQH